MADCIGFLRFNGVYVILLIKAIQLFLAEKPEYPEPKNTFLLYEGKKLPAKYIRGLAYKIAYKKEIPKADYQGGMETVRFFEKLGFETYYIGKDKRAKA